MAKLHQNLLRSDSFMAATKSKGRSCRPITISSLYGVVFF